MRGENHYGVPSAVPAKESFGRYDNLIAREAYRSIFKAMRLPESNFPPRYNIAPADQVPILRPYDPALMKTYAASRIVNSVKNDTPECVAPPHRPGER